MNVKLIFAVLTHVPKYGWRIDWIKGVPGFSVVECRDRPGLQADSEGGNSGLELSDQSITKERGSIRRGGTSHCGGVGQRGGRETTERIHCLFLILVVVSRGGVITNRVYRQW